MTRFFHKTAVVLLSVVLLVVMGVSRSSVLGESPSPSPRPLVAAAPPPPATTQLLAVSNKVAGPCPSLLREDSPSRRRVRQWWAAASPRPSSQCLPFLDTLEALVPHLPMLHPPCPTGVAPYEKHNDHLKVMDWREVERRQAAAIPLLPRCKPITGRKVYIDAGARKYSSSVAWFRGNYPEGRSFDVTAFDVDPKYAKGYRKDEKCKFVNAAVWNASGYVTFLLDSHNMHGTGGGKFTSHKPDPLPNAISVRSVSLVDILAQAGVVVEDFVVVKIDVEGAEWMLLRHLADTDSFRLVDEIFMECHNVDWNPRWSEVDGTSLADCHNMLDELRRKGVHVHEWY